jgi:hypothetical protein
MLNAPAAAVSLTLGNDQGIQLRVCDEFFRSPSDPQVFQTAPQTVSGPSAPTLK